MLKDEILEDKVHGCLLGQAIADSIGARFEGCVRDDIHDRFGDKETMFRFAAKGKRWYTDDTEMALAVAKYLVDHDEIVAADLMGTFVAEYNDWRGYGRGTQTLIDAFRMDSEYEHKAQHLFPGGSWGNGAAMRAAPVGIRFRLDEQQIWEQAGLSAWPTHRNELAIEGAQLIALATAVAIKSKSITAKILADALLPFAKLTVFAEQLRALATLTDETELHQFGNGIGAHESVMTAIGCFSLFPDDYEQAVATAIWQAGDTDTIAAMTGALSGARLGHAKIDPVLHEKLEPDTRFVDDVAALSKRLCAAAK